MRVLMKKTAAGIDGVYIAGKQYGDGEISESRAAEFVRAGAAIYTDRPQPRATPAAPESAALEPDENAAMPNAKPRRRGRRKDR